MHSWNKPYGSSTRELDASFHRVNVRAWYVTVVPSKIKLSFPCLEVFAGRTLQNGEVAGTSCGTMACQEYSSKKHKRKLYENGVLNVDVARLSKYVLQVHLQGGWIERVTERFKSKRALCVVLALPCACAFIDNFC